MPTGGEVTVFLPAINFVQNIIEFCLIFEAQLLKNSS